MVWAMSRAPHPDLIVEAGRYQPGMVISVLEDGQSPGSKIDPSPLDERSGGSGAGWAMLVDLEGVPKARMQALLSPMIREVGGGLPRRRLNGIDMAALEALHPRTNRHIPALEASVVATTLQYAAVEDIRDIGGDPQAIG